MAASHEGQIEAIPGIYIDAILDKVGLVALVKDRKEDFWQGHKGNSSKRMGRSKVKRQILTGNGWKIKG